MSAPTSPDTVAEPSDVLIDTFVDQFVGVFADGVIAADTLFGEPTVVLGREHLKAAARWLHDEAGFQFLRSVTCVDYLVAEPRFHVVYHVASIPASILGGDIDPSAGTFRSMRIKVPVPVESPVVDSVTEVYPTANWHEREVWDLFGVEFAGHPDLRRILLPEDFDGHPLRKDAPIRYENVQFSFNYDAIAAAKPRARE